MIEKTLFIKKANSEIILVQIYVDDIIFGATKDSLCEEFVAAMQEILKKFEMENCKEASTPMPSSCYMDANATGKKQVDQISCLSYVFVQDIMQNPKESHFKAAKRILKYLKGTTNVGLWYPSYSPIHLIGYSDSDFVGCKLDRKSTSDTCHLLGSSLFSWHSKKQACVALSTAEAEYIAAGSCCAQILWLKQQLADFGLKISKVDFCFC
ncbi:uncharacterized mitochondrial protein AtMg00810-like [Phaseolus vulgaris]|uniref:uncharacterized mitochondrial protein AtMg00810-like n=1 Tax=Phaseolus vulgaris TaxID=3885 RepID=UPI0035CB2A9A